VEHEKKAWRRLFAIDGFEAGCGHWSAILRASHKKFQEKARLEQIDTSAERTAAFCARCESRFSIAEFALIAPSSISQTLLRQGFERWSVMQYELDIAFDEAYAARGADERCHACRAGSPARVLAHRTPECVWVTKVDFRGDLSIGRQKWELGTWGEGLGAGSSIDWGAQGSGWTRDSAPGPICVHVYIWCDLRIADRHEESPTIFGRRKIYRRGTEGSEIHVPHEIVEIRRI
jgi:hypothetical protein